LMISAIPSSGSDWFASCLLRASRHVYYREFFNPLCNWENADRLGTVFGCESQKYSRNIFKTAFSGDRAIAQIFDELWVPSGNTMTKEVWVTEKLPALACHFNVVCFSREPKNSLPPGRARTVSWFHACACQLGIAGDFAKSAMLGYEFMHKSCVEVAGAIGVPFISWEDMVFGDKQKVRGVLEESCIEGIDCRLAAEIIVATRKEEPRKKLPEWSDHK